MQRMTIPEILENEWFKKDYKPAQFQEEDDVNLDDVDAVFNNSKVKRLLRSQFSSLTSLNHELCGSLYSEDCGRKIWLFFGVPLPPFLNQFFCYLWLQENLVTERKEKPTSMNAFELISRSKSFNLENLFEKQMVCSIQYPYFLCSAQNDCDNKVRLLVIWNSIIGSCETRNPFYFSTPCKWNHE